MRAFTRHSLVLTAVCSVGLSIWACDAKKQTEYVAGVSTQVQVPRDLKSVRVDINVGGVSVFCRTYKVYDGRVQLPRSLGSFPASGSPTGDPVTVTVVGFTDDAEAPARQDVYQCLTPVKATGKADTANARILRRSRQPYVKDEVLFLPMPLKFSCFDKDCENDSQSMTCKAGRCVDAVTDPNTLPTYDDDLINGTGGNCFHASECFKAALPAVAVDANDCTFAIPKTASSPPPAVDAGPIELIEQQGLNVLVSWDGGFTQEILDKDPTEGFIVPDPTKPQQFRLAPGLCDFVKGYDGATPPNVTPHRITGVFASPICQPKGPFQPLCANDQLAAMGVDTNGVGPNPTGCVSTEVKPPTSLLMIVADDTANSKVFYDTAAGATVKLSLSDPAFDSTLLGLTFTPGNTNPSCGPFDPIIPLALARTVQGAFGDAFKNETDKLLAQGSPVRLDGALGKVYDDLRNTGTPSTYRRAVFVIGNRSFNPTPTDCLGPKTSAQLAGEAFANPTAPIKTYVALLARDFASNAEDPTPIMGADALASAGSGGTLTTAFDARGSNQKVASKAFQTIVEDLATCVYDVPTALVKETNVLSYQDPLAPLNGKKKIVFNAGCNDGTVANTSNSGWGRSATVLPNNMTRIVMCGDGCKGYRDTRQGAADQAAFYLQSPPAVPMFFYDAACTSSTP